LAELVKCLTSREVTQAFASKMSWNPEHAVHPVTSVSGMSGALFPNGMVSDLLPVPDRTASLPPELQGEHWRVTLAA
jgi:hypothetical protein